MLRCYRDGYTGCILRTELLSHEKKTTQLVCFTDKLFSRVMETASEIMVRIY
jgi:hypothetical protein